MKYEKMFGMMLLLVGGLFAQNLNMEQIISPSDGFQYQVRDVIRNFGLFIADNMGAEDAVQARLMYKEEISKEYAKEMMLGNNITANKLQMQESVLNAQIERFSYGTTATVQQRIMQRIHAYEQKMKDLKEIIPVQGRIGIEESIQTSKQQKERIGGNGKQ